MTGGSGSPQGSMTGNADRLGNKYQGAAFVFSFPLYFIYTRRKSP